MSKFKFVWRRELTMKQRRIAREMAAKMCRLVGEITGANLSEAEIDDAADRCEAVIKKMNDDVAASRVRVRPPKPRSRIGK